MRCHHETAGLELGDEVSLIVRNGTGSYAMDCDWPDVLDSGEHLLCSGH